MPEKVQIEVENIRCGGCVRSITQGVGAIAGVSELHVDREKHVVSFRGDLQAKEQVMNKLTSMGYLSQQAGVC